MSTLVRQRSVSTEEDRPGKVPRIDNDIAAVRSVADLMAMPLKRTREYDNELDYRNKLVLAPMVRTGSLPTVRQNTPELTKALALPQVWRRAGLVSRGHR